MLLYFILGIVFIYIFIPIVDNLLTVFSTFTEYLCYKFALKIYKIKKELNITDDEEEEKTINPIGFSTDCIGFQVEKALECGQEEEGE